MSSRAETNAGKLDTPGLGLLFLPTLVEKVYWRGLLERTRPSAPQIGRE